MQSEMVQSREDFLISRLIILMSCGTKQTCSADFPEIHWLLPSMHRDHIDVDGISLL